MSKRSPGNVSWTGRISLILIPFAAACGIIDAVQGNDNEGVDDPVQTTSRGCTNTCEDAFDGICDDGGPGSTYSICDLGTDCADCGPRCLGPGQECTVNGDCCSGNFCVVDANGDGVDRCAAMCTDDTDCVSNCCVDLANGGGACVAADSGCTP